MTATFLLYEAGIQPSILLKLHKLGIHTLLDLLHYSFPSASQNIKPFCMISYSFNPTLEEQGIWWD